MPASTKGDPVGAMYGGLDIAEAIRTGRPHRANAELAYHVLDLMHAFHDSAHEGRHIVLSSMCNRPQPLPVTWP